MNSRIIRGEFNRGHLPKATWVGLNGTQAQFVTPHEIDIMWQKLQH